MKKKILYNMAGIYELQHMDKNADREFTGYVVAKDMLTKEETKISCTIVADELLKGRVVDGGEKPKVKRIYIVHTDALSEDDDRRFEDIPDEEIIDMYDATNPYIDCYESIEELAANWNNDEIFYPPESYMRVIEEDAQ